MLHVCVGVQRFNCAQHVLIMRDEEALVSFFLSLLRWGNQVLYHPLLDILTFVGFLSTFAAVSLLTMVIVWRTLRLKC